VTCYDVEIKVIDTSKAGYTSGGAPYGITWDELGIEPYAPYE
jgi:hypothetical protein